MSIPAPDGSLTYLHLGLAQPLTIPKVFYGQPAQAIGGGSGINTTVAMTSFTMPFYGDIVLQGAVEVATGSAGVQQVDSYVIGTPSPNSNPIAHWRTEGGSSYGWRSLLVYASWTGVASGTAVTVQAFIQNGFGAPSLQIISVGGCAYCTKT